MSHGNRLGKDPLSRSGTTDADAGRQALRHILDLGLAPTGTGVACDPGSGSEGDATGASFAEPPRTPAGPPAGSPASTAAPESAPDKGAIYREVAGKFSEAMDILSRLAAQAGVWAWGSHPIESGEGDSLLFMRIMAAYCVTPDGEGVDVAAFLNDVRDHWGDRNLALSLDTGAALLPLERAFTLARALQAALEGFCRPGRHGAALLNLDAAFTGRGGLKLRIHGYRDYFPSRESVFGAPGAESLVDLARQGLASLMFICTEETAELAVIV